MPEGESDGEGEGPGEAFGEGGRPRGRARGLRCRAGGARRVLEVHIVRRRRDLDPGLAVVRWRDVLLAREHPEGPSQLQPVRPVVRALRVERGVRLAVPVGQAAGRGVEPARDPGERVAARDLVQLERRPGGWRRRPRGGRRRWRRRRAGGRGRGGPGRRADRAGQAGRDGDRQGGPEHAGERRPGASATNGPVHRQPPRGPIVTQDPR